LLTREAVARLQQLAGPGKPKFEICGEGPFTVALNERLLFAGQCYGRNGAAWIPHPVMQIEEENEQIVLRIGEREGRWSMIGPCFDDKACLLMDPVELRMLFARLGRLRTDLP
jgi:hypothetical protein